MSSDEPESGASLRSALLRRMTADAPAPAEPLAPATHAPTREASSPSEERTPPSETSGSAESAPATAETAALEPEDASPANTHSESSVSESEPTPDARSGPAVTRVSPMRVDSRGGTFVMVYGAGFSPGCVVYVGADEVVGDVIDPFHLRFVAPAGEGTASVSVVAPAGARSKEPALLLFVRGPVLRRAVPSEGPIEGGIEVTLEGAGFQEGSTVSLFGQHAPDVVVENEERLRFVLPPAGSGPIEGSLTVTTPEGLSGTADGLFRYRLLQPRVDAVEPATAWVNGGKVIAIRGVDFHLRSNVRIGGAEATVTHRSPTQLDVEVPVREAPGPVDIEVENPDRRIARLERALTYEPVPAPPKILDLLPRSGLTTGGGTIRLVGDNFTEDCRIRLGEVTVVRKVVSAKLVDFELPPRTLPGPCAVEVTLAGVTVRAEDAFTYLSPAAAKIGSLEPRSGPTSGGTRVVIEGESFPKNASVRFGGEACRTVSVKGATRLEVVTPPLRTAGLVDVEVSSPETGRTLSPKAFRYEATPAPTMTLVSPPKGTVDGGTELSIEGKNFSEGVTVTIGGLPAQRVKRISGSVLEAFTPPGDDGKLVDVVVKNPDGQQAIQRRAFQYDARYRS